MKLPALTHGVSWLRRSFATFQTPLVVLWTKYIHPPAYTGGTLEPASCAGSFMRAHGASAQQDEACGSATAEAKRALSNRADYYRSVNLGINYYELDYGQSLPFLLMLPKSLG